MALELEIDEEFENTEEVILEEIDESEIVDESLFSFREIRENNPILGSLNKRSFPLKIQELKKKIKLMIKFIFLQDSIKIFYNYLVYRA